MDLVIGNQNYSSWSMRPWLLLSHFDIPFDEININLYQADSHERLAEYSPTLKVPVLIDEELTIWESLAILEYLNEHYLNGKGLPSERKDRALCRAYCAEMHAGFAALRQELPMNCRASRKVHISDACERDIHRIDGIWQDALNRHDGPWLFSDFTLADCMFAPVASRFATYGIEVSDTSQAYIDSLLLLPSMQRWYDAAAQETHVVTKYEIGTQIE